MHDDIDNLPGGSAVRDHCQFRGDGGQSVISDWRIEEMDVIEWAATYEGPQFHAMITSY